jgi:hypothetical protein
MCRPDSIHGINRIATIRRRIKDQACAWPAAGNVVIDGALPGPFRQPGGG